jgi:hypothetical protein
MERSQEAGEQERYNRNGTNRSLPDAEENRLVVEREGLAVVVKERQTHDDEHAAERRYERGHAKEQHERRVGQSGRQSGAHTHGQSRRRPEALADRARGQICSELADRARRHVEAARHERRRQAKGDERQRGALL